MKIASMICCGCALALAVPSSVDSADPKAIAKSHLQRAESYSGYMFDYISTHTVGDADPIVLENKLALFSPIDPDSKQLRRFWIATRKNPGDRWEAGVKKLVHCFKGYDGSEYRSFQRQYSDPQTKLLFHKSSVGTFDVRDYAANQFEEFLTAGPHLVPQYGDPWAKFIDTHAVTFVVKDHLNYLGRKAIRLEWPSAPNGDSFVATLLDGDGYLPLEVRVGHKGIPSLILQTTKLASHAGFDYPAVGMLKSMALGKIPAEEYSFKVTQVSAVSPESVFWPDWPLGTIASNSAGESVVSLPYPDEVREKVFGQHRAAGKSTIWLWSSVGVLMVGLVVYYLRRSRK